MTDSTPITDQPALSRRQFLLRTSAAAAMTTVGCGVYAWRFEPHWVDFTEVMMPMRGLPASMEGKRLVQVSDLHVGHEVDNDYLRSVLRRVTELEPDYLAITGDLMTSERGEQIEGALATLGELPLATTPTVAVLGNHDFGRSFSHRPTAEKLATGLRRLGIHLLRNESIEIDGLQIAGCGDLWANETNVWASLDSVDNERPTLFLAHNPDIVDLAGWGTMHGWILSGHTHGGQCQFPLIGAPFLPVRNRDYAAGYVRLDSQRELYVNRGLGHSRHQIRFAARPEVTQFTLTRLRSTA